jgi:hypothetical protein
MVADQRDKVRDRRRRREVGQQPGGGQALGAVGL